MTTISMVLIRTNASAQFDYSYTVEMERTRTELPSGGYSLVRLVACPEEHAALQIAHYHAAGNTFAVQLETLAVELPEELGS